MAQFVPRQLDMLAIAANLFDEMIAHAAADAPNECCGFLVGTAGVALRVLRLRNELASPYEYFAEPNDLFRAFKMMREDRLELIAIYHSHPTSEARPSRRDLAENHYEDTPHIIISLAGPTPVLKAFRLFAGGFDDLSCVRIDN